MTATKLPFTCRGKEVWLWKVGRGSYRLADTMPAQVAYFEAITGNSGIQFLSPWGWDVVTYYYNRKIDAMRTARSLSDRTKKMTKARRAKLIACGWEVE